MRCLVWMMFLCTTLGSGCSVEAVEAGGGAESGTTTGPAGSTTGSTSSSDSTAAGVTTSIGSTSSQDADASTATSSDSSTADEGTGTSGTDAGSSTGERVLPECTYPLSWPTDPAAEALAQDALDAIAPEATMTWHEDRGTFSALADLDVVIECPDDEPLLDAVFAFFALHPDLFPMQADEWFTGGGNLCQHVTSPTPSTFNTSRREMGPWTVARDVIAPRLYRNDDGDVVLRSVSGTFVPRLTAELEQQVSDCIANGPNATLLEDTLREEPFDYLIYGGPVFCGPAGSGTYTADDADAVVFSDQAELSWYEAGDGTTTVTIAQRVELIIDPANVTESLEASNAACPNPDGPGTVYGFAAYMDLVTAEIGNKLAGLGCIVC
ncbi:MAG: hypothetical protein AAGA54_08210 [Myxococcota bacterium]